MPYADPEVRRNFHREYKRLHPQKRTPEQKAEKARKNYIWSQRPEVKAHRKKQTRIREKLQKYGLTEEQYQSMLSTQNGVCSLCGGVNSNGYELYIDHDHATGKVRGLLCNKCNAALGLVSDNIQTLTNMIAYLTHHNV